MCSEYRAREGAILSAVPREVVVADFFEPQHVLAEHSDKEEVVGRDGISKVCSSKRRSFAFLPRNRARDKVHG